MLKPFTLTITKLVLFTTLTLSLNVLALDSDREVDLVLDADKSTMLPQVKNGLASSHFWGNVSIEQGTLKIQADDAVVYNSENGIDKVIIKGSPVKFEQFVDVNYGKINIQANQIDFMMKDKMLFMTGDVIIISKIQGQMRGQKISMNLETKEIKGINSKESSNRVRLIIPGKK